MTSSKRKKDITAAGPLVGRVCLKGLGIAEIEQPDPFLRNLSHAAEAAVST